jgi:hypothetical protein
MATQKLRLKLDGNCLTFQRYGKDGNLTGKPESWQIGKESKKSNVPKALFYLLWGYVHHRVSQRDDKSIENVRKAVLRGLCEAAKACGCKPSFGQEGGDVLWTLRGEPFFAFQIHEESLRRETARKLRRGRARLRWVAVVKKGGYVKFVPRKARRVSEEADSD